MNALEYAIDMELDGEKYYRQQAELNSDNGIKTVCLILAQDENKHAQILKSKLKNEAYELIDTDAYSKTRNVFEDMGSFKSDIKATPSQLDFYRTALQIEKRSIDLYRDMGSKSADEKDRALFKFLTAQENKHFSIIDEMVRLLRHAEEWVESAEFGIRTEEY